MGLTKIRNPYNAKVATFHCKTPNKENDLESIIKTNPDLCIAGEPLDNATRKYLMKIIRASGEFIKQKKTSTEV